MGDAILLIRLIQTASGLLAKLKEQGREELTPDERAQLGLPDDAAREKLVDAIERARVAGR